ncbi:MAG: hypothetical protein ACK50V_01355 [Alphaproteobacteria bacterium]
MVDTKACVLVFDVNTLQDVPSKNLMRCGLCYCPNDRNPSGLLVVPWDGKASFIIG